MARPRWALLLSAYLFIWIPLNFAVLATQVLPSVGRRGAGAQIELALNAVGALLCAAAGWMLYGGTPAGRLLAQAALVVNAALTIHALHASRLPRDVTPGSAMPFTILTALHAAAWILYLRRSRALRAWLDGVSPPDR
jgi:hypothetical protein